MDKDITEQCEFGENDGECLPLERCACGQAFGCWENVLGTDGNPDVTCSCGRKLYFRNKITIYERT